MQTPLLGLLLQKTCWSPDPGTCEHDLIGSGVSADVIKAQAEVTLE